MTSLTRYTLLSLIAAFLFGCSGNADKQRQIEAIAQHRATTLSNSLPIEHGPLTIMQAKAVGNSVQLMMIYNGEAASSAQQLLEGSIRYYCNNSEVKANLVHGVIYNIKLRSPRGKLLAERVITENSCAKKAE